MQVQTLHLKNLTKKYSVAEADGIYHVLILSSVRVHFTVAYTQHTVESRGDRSRAQTSSSLRYMAHLLISSGTHYKSKMT